MAEQQEVEAQQQGHPVDGEIVIGYLKHKLGESAGEMAMLTARNIQLEQQLNEARETIDQLTQQLEERSNETPTAAAKKKTGGRR